MEQITSKFTKKAVKIWWVIALSPIFFIAVLFTLIASGNLWFLPESMRFMPTFEELENPESNLAAEIISADQQLLGKYYRENRTVVQFDNLSPVLVNALVATEDIRFYEHSGIDPRGLGRVLFKTVILGQRNAGGGSTITQQLAKNLFPRDKTKRSKLAKIFVMVMTKFKEWVIAVKLERNYTKEEILAMYLNTVEFGSQAFGIKAAARTFFDKSPDSLHLEEAAVLVGLLKAPTWYSPIRNPERSKKRRNVVLGQMYKYGFISKEVYDSTKALPLVTHYSVASHTSGIATYFREYLRKIMTAKKPERKNYASWQSQKFYEDSLSWANNPLYGWCNKNIKPNGKTYDLYSDGLKIYTTINSRMQKYAEDAMKEHMGGYLQPLFDKEKKRSKKAPFDWKMSNKQIHRILYLSMLRSERYRVLKQAGADSAVIIKNFKTPVRMQVFSWKGDIDTTMTPWDSIRYYKKFLHAGVMSMEPQTGYVKAYVGDINFKHFKFDNVMIAKRQVGSTFKPIIYTVAMMPGGFSPCHRIPNVPVSFIAPNEEGEEAEYTPRFSKSKFDGEMIPLRMGLALSLNQISAWIMKQYNPGTFVRLAHKMGIVSEIPEVYSICVGAAEIKLSEMVAAYDTYVNKGVQVEPVFVTRIEDQYGNIVATFKPKKHEVISEQTAYKMIDLMKGVVDYGTSTRLRYRYNFKNEIAGKTGTTNDNSDGWFIGMVPNLVTGIWVGGEERSIRFDNGAYGQGANMALPIWALYMQQVYADESLQISKANFEIPPGIDLNQLDCSKYKETGSDNPEDFNNPENDIY
jgi:penicillin-binding protein 1A